MAGELKKYLVMSHKGSKTSKRTKQTVSLDSSQQVNKIVQANNEVNCTRVLKYHKCFQLWITVKWPRSYTLSLNITIVFMYLRLLGHPRYCVGKWKFKHLDRRFQRTIRFRFIHEKFLKSLGCMSSKMFHTLNWNWILLVPWSSLQNSASFSVEQPKSAIKLQLLNE